MSCATDKTLIDSAQAEWLVEVLEPCGRRLRHLVRDEIIIGRGAECPFKLTSWRIARRHACLRVTPAGLLIEDQGALGGTWVNGQRIVQRGPLTLTDEITIGPYRLRILGVPATADATELEAFSDPEKSSLANDFSNRLQAFPADKPPLNLNPVSILPIKKIQAKPEETKPIFLADFLPEVDLNTGDSSLADAAVNTVFLDTLFFEWQRLFHRRLLEALDLRRQDVSRMSDDMLRQQADEVLTDLMAVAQTQAELPPQIDPVALRRAVIDEAVGLGPLETLLQDESVSEIMVNRFDQIYVERAGRMHRHPMAFSSDQAVLAIIERIVAPIGRRIDESSPMVDARLKDGSRVNAIIPPLALKGPALTIRKFPIRRLRLQDLIERGALSSSMGQFLQVCIEQRKNVVVSGGTGSGKTTLLNILSNFIPPDERVLTIEDAAELRLHHPHWVALEARPANAEGRGAVAIRDLVRNALRMRPDRIVIGECRGAEALDMLQAMNTGHEGALTTLHANSPRDALARLETMVLMSDLDLPLVAIREQIAAAVDIIVQQQRAPCGMRRITSIVELTGLEGQRFQLQELFRFDRQFSSAENSNGVFRAHGIIPNFYETLSEQGVVLDRHCFADAA